MDFGACNLIHMRILHPMHGDGDALSEQSKEDIRYTSITLRSIRFVSSKYGSISNNRFYVKNNMNGFHGLLQPVRCSSVGQITAYEYVSEHYNKLL